MVLNGNIDNIQSSLDFYLSITSKNLVDSKYTKDRFFSIFENEDAYRDENFLLFQEKVSEDSSILYNSEPILVGEEECFVFGKYSFAKYNNEDDYPNDTEVYISNNSELEMEKNNLDKDFYNSDNDSSSLDIEEDDLDDEFINYTNDTLDDEFIDYSSDNEEESEDCNTFSSVDTNSFYSNDDYVKNNQEDNEYKDSWGNYSEEYSEEDDDNDLIEFNNSVDVDTIVEEEQKNKVISVKEDTSKEEELFEVPKDLREFVKLHHNCEMSLALKYFTKKEIDRQLSLGRVFKRKNKLLI